MADYTLLMNFRLLLLFELASLSSDNAFTFGAKGLRFKTHAGQLVHSVANDSTPLQHFSKGIALSGCNDAEMGPVNSLHATAYHREYEERFD